MNFTNLNKVWPENSFLMLAIDRLVDASAGHKVLSFMDAFSSYNQIKMDPANQEKTTFINEDGLFCYKVMLFGLKN